MQGNLESSYEVTINWIWFTGACVDFPEIAICCPQTLFQRLLSNQNAATSPLQRRVRAKFSEVWDRTVRSHWWSRSCSCPACVCAFNSSEAVSQKLSWSQTIRVRENGSLYLLTVKGILKGLYIIYRLMSMGILLSGELQYSTHKKETSKVKGNLIKTYPLFIRSLLRLFRPVQNCLQKWPVKTGCLAHLSHLKQYLYSLISL